MTNDARFGRYVLEPKEPVLCLFQAAGHDEKLLTSLTNLLDHSIGKIIDTYCMQTVVALGHFAPEAVERECAGFKLPLMQIYRGGRSILIVPLDPEALSGASGRKCTLAIQTALDAPWNQPGVGQETFRPPV